MQLATESQETSPVERSAPEGSNHQQDHRQYGEDDLRQGDAEFGKRGHRLASTATGATAAVRGA